MQYDFYLVYNRILKKQKIFSQSIYAFWIT